MSKQLIHKQHNRAHRKARIRSVIKGTAKRPRLAVYVSNLHITAQLIDDTAHNTIGYATTVGSKTATGSKSEKAAVIGSEIAAAAKTAKVKTVVFDRGGKLYHGRVAALAEAARKSGLEF